jgi:hypothetical protein
VLIGGARPLWQKTESSDYLTIFHLYNIPVSLSNHVWCKMLAPMLRRARMVLGYMPTNPDTDPSLSYSPFGWNYLLPQGMHTPFTTNRSASPAPRRRGPVGAYGVVCIDT